METRANYVAVGAFVLACVIGLVVTILWLAGTQYSQEYAYYQTFFKGPVTGLGKGTITRYNGIEVGRITDLAFDPNDPQSVVVTLQVQPGLNIREDSVASIESQGLTGATYVEISGGTKNSPILEAKPGQRYPVIRAKQSTLQQLEQSAPEVVAKLNVAASRLNDLLNDNNRRAITRILTNLDQTTATIAKRSADIDATVKNASQATANLRDASESLKPTIAAADATVKKYGKVADDADAFINGDGLAQLSELISETRRLVASLTKFSDQLNRDPSKLLFGDRRKGYEPK
ncbi:MAG TPA: MlaD family protein [Rhizomicrobium sp.]|nr:MlaD family protein [Rhizomicrobium sp.]